MPSWARLCLDSSSDRLNRHSQPGQLQMNGFSPVCRLRNRFENLPFFSCRKLMAKFDIIISGDTLPYVCFQMRAFGIGFGAASIRTNVASG